MGDRFRRRKKLIKPLLQLRLVSCFVGLAALAVLLQFLLMGYRMVDAATLLEGEGGQLADEVPQVLLEVFALTLLGVLPIILGFGVVLTFRLAGPVYRFEQFLEAVARGDQIGPCKIRKGDEFQPLCDLINEVTEPLRRRATELDAPFTGEDVRAAG